MYWVRATQTLSAEAGMHRFLWDLHFPPPQALDHEFPISAIVHDTPQYPLGAYALPGRYTVKLTVDGKSYTQPLTVKMDPRIKTSEAGLRKQFEMEMGTVQGMNESFAALQQVRSLRAQLADRSRVTKSLPASLTEAIQALDKQAADLEGATRTPFFGVPSSGKEPENFSTLNQHFGTLLSVADSADAAPTTQAIAVYQELESSLQGLLAGWKKLQHSDIPALNTLLKQSGLAGIDPNKSPDSQPANAGGEDEP
jgi:hypothetical protein